MEPKLPAPNLGPELPPVRNEQPYERVPVPPTPETGLVQAGERLEQRSEAAPATVGAPITLPAPVKAPVSSTPSDDTVTSATDDMPLIANDDDLIEKEWVDKAKKIIVQTKDDPYRREQEVSKLQADYLRKRYGRELGAPQ